MNSPKNQFQKHLLVLREVVEKNKYSSFHNHILDSPDFQAIVVMGKNKETSFLTIKLLFEDLLQENTWETVLALSAILEYWPEAESVGVFQLLNFPQMCEELISRGKRFGYI